MFCDNAILNIDPGYSIEGTGLPVSIRQACSFMNPFLLSKPSPYGGSIFQVLLAKAGFKEALLTQYKIIANNQNKYNHR